MSLSEDLKQPGTSADDVRRMKRRIVIKRLDQIEIEPVRWLWKHRIASGMFGLMPGREGLGKSLVAYQVAADISRGKLDGDDFGTPRKVLICATEDSYAHTVVPRLMAAGADLEKIGAVELLDDGREDELQLPIDLLALTARIKESDVALVVLDPLMSRLSARLDTHKDSDVRRALEPLTKLAEDTGAAVLGIIHVNKGSNGDPLNSVMGSRAFTAVARWVLFIAADPDEEHLRVLGQAKNNCGPSDGLPLLPFRIEPHAFQSPAGEQIETVRLVWQAPDDTRTLREVVRQGRDESHRGAAREEAEGWLLQFLEASPEHRAPSAEVKKAGREAGHSPTTLKRAADALGVVVTPEGRTTWWSIVPAAKLPL